jgi:hypothetical protein
MTKILSFLKQVLSPIISGITGLIIFPTIENKGLYQSKVPVACLAGVIVLLVYLLFVFVVDRFKPKKGWLFLSAALLTPLAIWLLLWNYYPYVNANVINLKHECGFTFIRGDEINPNIRRINQLENPDSLAVANPGLLVQYLGCDPKNAWTSKSIENVYNGMLWRFCLFFAVASLAIFTLAKSALKAIIPTQP